MSHQYTQTVFLTPKSWHLPSFMWQLGIGRKYGTFIMQMAWLWKELSKLHFLHLVPFCLFLAGSSDVGKGKAVCQGGVSGYWNRSCNGLRTGLVGPASSCVAIEGGAGQGCTTWPDFLTFAWWGQVFDAHLKQTRCSGRAGAGLATCGSRLAEVSNLVTKSVC